MDNLFPTGTIDPQVTERELFEQQRLDGIRAADAPNPLLEIEFKKPSLEGISPVEAIKKTFTLNKPTQTLVEQDHMAYWAEYTLKKLGIGDDPTFRLDPAKVKTDIAGMDEAWNEELFEANSQDEYDFILNAGKKWTEREQEIARMGGTGVAARLITNILDPSMVALALGGEALLPAAFAAKGTRLARILKTGGAIGTLNAAAEGAYMGLNPTTDMADVGTVFGLGLVFGGTAGALRGSSIGQELAAQGKKIIDHNETRPIPVPRGDDTKHPRKMFVRKDPTVSPAEDANYQTYNAGSLSSAGNPDARAALTPDYQPINTKEDGEGVLEYVRMDAVGAARRASDSNWFKQSFAAILTDGVGAKSASDLDVSEMSASMLSSRYVSQAKSHWFELVQPEYRKWRKRNSVGWAQHYMRGKGIFANDVGSYMEYDPMKHGRREYDPEVVAAGNRAKDMLKQTLIDLKAARVPGYEHIPENSFYLPKYLDKHNVADIIRDAANVNGNGGGWRALVPVVENAIKRNSPDIDPALLKRYAEGYMSKIAHATHHLNDGLAMAQNDLGNIVAHIHDVLPDIDGADARALAGSLHRKGGSDPRTMSRAGLDYDHKTKVWMDDGKGGQELRDMSVGDFFIKDAEFALMRYTRQAAGQLALAKVQIRDGQGNIVMDGIRGQAGIDKLKAMISNDYATMHGAGYTRTAQEVADLEKIDWSIGHVLGSYSDMTVGARGKKYLRRVQDYNFVRLMNNMGVNQVQEFVGIYNQYGVKAMIKGVPKIGRLFDAMGNTKVRDEVVSEVQGWLGMGQDTIFDKSSFRYDHEQWNEARSSTFGTHADRALLWSKEQTLKLSGMKYINAGLQQWAMKSAVMRFAEMAGTGLEGLQRGGKIDQFFRGKDLQRLRSLGLRDADLTSIFKHFNDPTIVKRSASGKVEQLNFSKWDPDTRVKFTDAIYRATQKAIQQNDAGELAKWMQTDLAKFTLQFKSFLLGAYTKQFLYGLRHMDFRQVVSWFMQIGAGMVTYYGMSKARQLAFNDEQQAKADADGKLGWRDTILQGLARAPVMTMFPTAIDAALSTFAGQDAQLFAQSRASGQSTGGIDSLPITGAANGLLRTGKGIYHSLADDREMTQSEKLGVASAVPQSNWLPLAIFLKYLTNESPTR